MHGKSKGNQTFHLKKIYIVLVLVLAVLLFTAGGSMAWLRYIRSLQTVTQVVVTELSLKGPNENTIPIDLDGINVSESDSVSYVFGVRSNNVEEYWIQLGYTTNLDLTYTVYQATKENALGYSSSIPTGSLTIGDSLFICGNELNDTTLIRINHQPREDLTYKTGLYQTNANPLYWQYGPIRIKKHETQYFILNISWGKQSNMAKETDMIYLTVGTGGLGSSAGSEEANP